MHIIATDEAGYGPKLGPLVIAGTSWHINSASTFGDRVFNGEAGCFAPLASPVHFGTTQTRVDDSKAVFKPGKGNHKLSMIVWASSKWWNKDYRTLNEFIELVAPDDADSVSSVEWFKNASPQTGFELDDVHRAIQFWAAGGIQLVGMRSKVIIAKSFNHFIERGWNKADLLSQATLDLVRSAIDEIKDDCFEVFCDRHGGRRYYLGVLQHTFSEANIKVIAETKTVSRYKISWGDREIRISFTVKGDQFPPVAMSSIHAKFLREWMMESFNRYFATHHSGESELRPTAGYPVDADRFLHDIHLTLTELGIDQRTLVRAR